MQLFCVFYTEKLQLQSQGNKATRANPVYFFLDNEIKMRRGRPKSADSFSHNRKKISTVRERVDRFCSTLAHFFQCKKLARKSPVGFRSFYLVSEMKNVTRDIA